MLSPASVIFAPMYGTPAKPRDYVSFQGWARAFLRYHGLPADNLVLIDNHQSDSAMRAATLDALTALATAPDGLPVVVAWCCHGLARRIQLGWRVPDTGRLADALAVHGGADVRVMLYCCSTASKPSGFAASLHAALVLAGSPRAEVIGHATAGRADANPYCRKYPDGDWIIAPGSPQWSAWRQALRGDMRWQMATTTTEEIRAAI